MASVIIYLLTSSSISAAMGTVKARVAMEKGIVAVTLCLAGSAYFLTGRAGTIA